MKFIIGVYCLLCLPAIRGNSQSYQFDRVSSLLDESRQRLGGSFCAMVWKDGRMIYLHHAGNLDSASILPIASCSKWLTAALVMIYVDRGKISLEDSIGKFLPAFTLYGKGQIKIRQCLSHTTGLDSPHPGLAGLIEEGNYPSLEAQVNDFAKNKILAALPGKVFRYSTVGLNIAGRILEVISHEDFDKLFQENLARPLGMYNTSFIGKGMENPSGGASSTAADYMRFLIMILNRGQWMGRQMISEKSIQAMQSIQTSQVDMQYVPMGAKDFPYALGEWIEEQDSSGKSIVVTSPGLFGSWPMVDNKRKYAALVFIKKYFINEQIKAIFIEMKNRIDNQLDIFAH